VRLQKIKERFGDRITIRWHPFALRPQYDPTPFRFQGSYVEGAWRRISAMVASEGLEYRMWDKDEFPRWSMPGLEAGIAAQRQGEDAFHRFHLGLYRSFFTESKSLIDKDNLVAVARDAGLDMNTFMHDIDDHVLQESVRKQCQDAMETYYVTAVPTVIIGGKRRRIGMVPSEEYLQDLAILGVKD
jgi:predicted DsbA family dithiol-disulfide isomerase